MLRRLLLSLRRPRPRRNRRLTRRPLSGLAGSQEPDLSAACAALGYVILRSLPTVDGRLARAVAAGAMLTMLADAMMPEAFEHGGKLVGLLTAIGFVAAAVSFAE